VPGWVWDASASDVRYRALMRRNSQYRHLTVGLLTILVGALLVTACGGGSESGGTAVAESRVTVVAVDLVAGAGEVTYVVGASLPETVRVSVPCAQEVAVGKPIPSSVQTALSTQLDAAGVEEATAAGVLEGTERIAFTSYRDDAEIYTMRSDGTDVRQLTANAASDFSPDWSPDGIRIAFHSDRDGDSKIYTMRADGTDVRQLTVNDGTSGSPAWSPDGTRIAFDSARHGKLPGIYIMRSDGADVRQLMVEALDLSADGLTASEVAERMSIATSTVETHLKHAREKLGVKGLTGAQSAAALARARG